MNPANHTPIGSPETDQELITDLARSLGAAEAQINQLRAALSDIGTTAHCLAKAGPLTTPTLDAAWSHFMAISAKATGALGGVKKETA